MTCALKQYLWVLLEILMDGLCVNSLDRIKHINYLGLVLKKLGHIIFALT